MAVQVCPLGAVPQVSREGVSLHFLQVAPALISWELHLPSIDWDSSSYSAVYGLLEGLQYPLKDRKGQNYFHNKILFALFTVFTFALMVPK